MTQKTENWKEALLRVREGLKEANEPVVEKTEEELINEEIDALLNEMEEPSEEVTEETEEVSEETQETEEGHSVDKLTEKNMLGRLAKSMSLNEDNKQKLFDYFESGELEQ